MSQRLTLYPRLLLLALGAAFVFVVLSGDGSSTASGRVGGDYPAFYTAGTLINEGQIDDLYDPVAQAEVQETLLGDEDGYLAFAYAPHVAAAYAPLASLDYRLSYVVHTGLMVAALIGALHLIRPMVGIVDRWFSLVLAAVVTSYPMFMAIGGGQNTALTLLLLAAVWRALADDRDALAGVAAALMLFRPQYGIPVMGLLLLGWRPRAVAVAAVGGVATFLANVAIMGWDWVGTWLDRVGPFLETDAEVNAANSVSTVGFLQALFGTDSTIAVVVGGLVTLAVIALLAWVWWDSAAELGLRMALTATGLALLSPHTMFYDAGLVVITLLVLVDRGRVPWTAAALVWVLALTHLAKNVFDASPFALVVMAIFAIAARATLTPPQESAVRSDELVTA